MDSMLVTLLSVLLGGGGGDLLDYVQPAAYWQSKQVAVSVEAMGKELAPPPAADVSKFIDDLNSPDPHARQEAARKIADAGIAALAPLREAAASPSPQIAVSAKRLISQIEEANRPASVRRLMAIRALGDLKDKAALPILEPLRKSETPFVADYAREAIDQINGKVIERPNAPGLRDDIWLLPGGCRAVGQVMGPTSGPVDVQQQIKRAMLPGKADPAVLFETANKMVTDISEKIGNLRVESLTIGIAGDVGEQSGYVILIAHGQYDAKAVADLMHKQQVPSNVVGGVEIFQLPGAETALFFPDNHYAVLIASPRGIDQPIDEIVAAIRTGQGKLKDVPEMKKLIDQSPAGQPLWAVAKITPAFAKGAVLAPFDTMEIRSKRDGKQVQVTVSGTGNQPDKAKMAAAMVSGGARQGAEEIKRAEQFEPNLKVVEEMLRSVNCTAQEGNATLTAQMDVNQAGILLLPTMMMGRVAAAPVPAPNAAPATQPAQK